MTFLPYVLLVMLGLVAWYGYRRQAETYEQVISILERARDEARHEAQVFRRLVLPVFDKVERDRAEMGSLSPAPSHPPGMRGADAGASGTTNHTPQAPVPSPFNPRRRWVVRMKDAMRATNTKQKNTDTLARALERQSIPVPNPKENQNAQTR